MKSSYSVNTLQFDLALCTGCGMCTEVCPHAVFTKNGKKVLLTNYVACMECGACQLNCPEGAISVDGGVGCAYAMIKAAITGSEEECCGGPDGSSCC